MSRADEASKNRESDAANVPEKKRLARGVELEHRRYIGFERKPVQDPTVKPVVHGLPTRGADVERA